MHDNLSSVVAQLVMNEERARVLHKHREFLHDAHDQPEKLEGATADQICALLQLLCAIFKKELWIPQDLKSELEELPEAKKIKRQFQSPKLFEGILKRTVEEPDFGEKILNIVGKGAQLALKAFKWLF